MFKRSCAVRWQVHSFWFLYRNRQKLYKNWKKNVTKWARPRPCDTEDTNEIEKKKCYNNIRTKIPIIRAFVAWILVHVILMCHLNLFCRKKEQKKNVFVNSVCDSFVSLAAYRIEYGILRNWHWLIFIWDCVRRVHRKLIYCYIHFDGCDFLF